MLIEQLDRSFKDKKVKLKIWKKESSTETMGKESYSLYLLTMLQGNFIQNK